MSDDYLKKKECFDDIIAKLSPIPIFSSISYLILFISTFPPVVYYQDMPHVSTVLEDLGIL